jgi:hypothetical protein
MCAVCCIAVPQHGAWKTGFNKHSEDLKTHWKETLPASVDVLVTHTPCRGGAGEECCASANYCC